MGLRAREIIIHIHHHFYILADFLTTECELSSILSMISLKDLHPWASALSQLRFQHSVTATERVYTAFTVPFNRGFKSAALEAGMNVLRMLQPEYYSKLEQEDWVA